MLKSNINQKFHAKPELIISGILVLAVFIIFKQTGAYSFISFDDMAYVKNNVYLINGISVNNIVWAFTTGLSGNWHPITWISYMLDVELYGLTPGMLHMSNVFFHAINSMLLFFVLKKLTGKEWRSGFVAILFAIHPLHVESVAWISERKDVLSSFFGFLSILFYIQFTQIPKIKNYLLSIFFFVLGLMSKSMLVTIPFILLLLDFWPLNRLHFDLFHKNNFYFLKKNKFILIEKIPFLFFSLCMCIITLYTQKEGNAVASLDIYPMHLRIGNALISYTSYLKKIFCPADLSVLYPRPESIPFLKIFFSLYILSFITWFAVKAYSSKPYLLIGWLWYLGMLAPVIGIVQVGMQGMADRYTYIPSIGIFISFIWLVFDLLNGKKRRMLIGSIWGSAILFLFVSISYKQTSYWKNSLLLYNHSISVTKSNYVLHRFLGDVLMDHKQFEKSEDEFLKAIKINPNYVAGYNGLGSLYLETNRYKDASQFFHKGLTVNSNNTGLLNNLGVTYAKLHDFESAIQYFQKALTIDPDFMDAQNNIKMANKLIKKN